jgi:hypothetical protein
MVKYFTFTVTCSEHHLHEEDAQFSRTSLIMGIKELGYENDI